MTTVLTARLSLAPLDRSLAEHLVGGTPRPRDRWGPGYPDDGDRAGARRFLRLLAEDGDPGPFGAYEIRVREDGVAIGGAGFHGPANAAGRVTVGFGLIPAARGRGYAAEALRALLDHARAHGARGVDGDADRENVASQRVMAAAGMRFLREDDRLCHHAVTWTDR
ncbi:GNAT family N-acetyltransferase [Streptomyces sp. NPDC102278]|uniref:GNAT family N-acetyltransferase n=1 Tax=Streptomyces sp. NPDC102278 TaxID=3366152 RepID=UPI0037F1CCEF